MLNAGRRPALDRGRPRSRYVTRWARLAISYFCQDDPGAMQGPLEETLAVAEAIGDEDDIRWCLWCLAHTAFSAGEMARARAHGERALAMMPEQDQLSRYCAVEVLSLLDAHTGAADAARERAEADLEQSRQEKLRLGTGVLTHALGVAALATGDLDRAEQWAARPLRGRIGKSATSPGMPRRS